MKAVDNDKGHNGQVRYSIVQQPNQKGTKFIVDEITGDIRTNKVSINVIKQAKKKKKSIQSWFYSFTVK